MSSDICNFYVSISDQLKNLTYFCRRMFNGPYKLLLKRFFISSKNIDG